ncbi:alpha/beta hydrolase [Ramlibacter henchirensis]|uniref:Alpha/beta hydrolase n=1 Tax=Ramlibacter henchirensis TaxID=204072 RepID=A0A4Z0C5T7_9BURK|nr:alpha/beta hydrolase [Ramlibacter henchirensis]TFZ05708.1 alpha/beta hydrolase [Ramlibacter henchirensis]
MAAPASTPGFRVLPVPGLGRDVRVWGRKARGKAMPLVLHFHGGSFTTGDLDSGAQLATLIAGAGAVVASFDYPLAPQHRFPEAVEAGYAVLLWLHRQRTVLAGRDAPLHVAGEEAGASLAAAVAMMARDRRQPALAGQILVSPMLDPCTATPSLRDKLGEQVECRWAEGWQNYLRGPMDAEHPYAVPGRARRLVDLPRTLVLTGSDDPMRDEAAAYAQRLRGAGVSVTCAMLEVPTGWPESLEHALPQDCPCAGQASCRLADFFQAPIPPPS